jgi:hypothetical protein
MGKPFDGGERGHWKAISGQKKIRYTSDNKVNINGRYGGTCL